MTTARLTSHRAAPYPVVSRNIDDLFLVWPHHDRIPDLLAQQSLGQG